MNLTFQTSSGGEENEIIRKSEVLPKMRSIIQENTIGEDEKYSMSIKNESEAVKVSLSTTIYVSHLSNIYSLI